MLGTLALLRADAIAERHCCRNACMGQQRLQVMAGRGCRDALRVQEDAAGCMPDLQEGCCRHERHAQDAMVPQVSQACMAEVRSHFHKACHFAEHVSI